MGGLPSRRPRLLWGPPRSDRRRLRRTADVGRGDAHAFRRIHRRGAGPSTPADPVHCCCVCGSPGLRRRDAVATVPVVAALALLPFLALSRRLLLELTPW